MHGQGCGRLLPDETAVGSSSVRPGRSGDQANGRAKAGGPGSEFLEAKMGLKLPRLGDLWCPHSANDSE